MSSTTVSIPLTGHSGQVVGALTAHAPAFNVYVGGVPGNPGVYMGQVVPYARPLEVPTGGSIIARGWSAYDPNGEHKGDSDDAAGAAYWLAPDLITDTPGASKIVHSTVRTALGAFAHLDRIQDRYGLMDQPIKDARFVLDEQGCTFMQCGGEVIMSFEPCGREYGPDTNYRIYLVRDDTRGSTWQAYKLRRETPPPELGSSRPQPVYRLVLSPG